MRAVGIDLGERRIGVAVSDRTGTLASPYSTIERGGDADTDRRAIVAVVAETGAERVVVGLPLSMNGRVGPAARRAQAEAAALTEVLAPLGVAVETVDERLSTVSASRPAGVRAPGPGPAGHRRPLRGRRHPPGVAGPTVGRACLRCPTIPGSPAPTADNAAAANVAAGCGAAGSSWVWARRP